MPVGRAQSLFLSIHQKGERGGRVNNTNKITDAILFIDVILPNIIKFFFFDI